MTTRPWMPLYIADYLADTAHLNAAEHGAYLLLIMHYWRAGGLPDDEDQLRRISRMTARQWSQSRDLLRSLFGDQWRHKRIDMELAQAIEKSRTNSANAKRRHSERTKSAERSDTQSQSQSQSQSQKEKKVPAPSAAPAARQADLDLEIIDEAPKAKLFRKGKTILVSLGLSEKRSGAVIGEWLKKKNDPEGVLAAIIYARDQGVIEPIGYVTRLLNSQEKSNGANRKQSLGDLAEELAREAEQLEREKGLGRPIVAI